MSDKVDALQDCIKAKDARIAELEEANKKCRDTFIFIMKNYPSTWDAMVEREVDKFEVMLAKGDE